MQKENSTGEISTEEEPKQEDDEHRKKMLMKGFDTVIEPESVRW